MSRIHADWLEAFCDYARFGEAPRRMYFWAGVSAIAGALRRKVWIDQAYFRWYPNFYIVLVAPPGIVSKSTTASVAMQLLRRVPRIKFGPDVVTWQALVSALADSSEMYQTRSGDFVTMSSLTIESSEFGNLVNPADRDMLDLLITLYDCKSSIDKRTKGSGNDSVENAWFNIIACTTPSWLASSFTEHSLNGGFVSRCIFVYAHEKAQYVAYPFLHVPEDIKTQEDSLVHDLEHISVKLDGAYSFDPAALAWGEDWYRQHFAKVPANLDLDRFGGYIARKQTHTHKLAMVLAASQRDDLVITKEDLMTATAMVTDLEQDMPGVFSKIGRTEASSHAERFINYVKQRGRVQFAEAYRFIHPYFPSGKEFEDMLYGLIASRRIELRTDGNEKWLVFLC